MNHLILLLTVWCSIWTHVTAVFEIVENTVTHSYSLEILESVVVRSEAFWSVFLEERILISGLQIELDAKCYMTFISGEETSVHTNIEQTFENYGELVIMSLGQPDSFWVSLNVEVFRNHGVLIAAVEETSEAHQVGWFMITSEGFNDGVIAFHKTDTAHYTYFYGSYESPFINNGDICLNYTRFAWNNDVSGSGCFHVMNGSIFEPSTFNQIEQTVQFYPDFFGTMLLEPPYTDFFDPSLLKVRGFGHGNAIGVRMGQRIESFEYSGSMLTISTGYDSVYANIGEGYDESLFRVADFDDSGYVSENQIVMYDGPVPEGLEWAANCNSCPPRQEAPSEVPCEECTTFTSTWVTTEDNVTATDSGVIVVTTDEEGVLTTSTSVFPRPTCEECTTFATTWITTDEEGTHTDSGVVVVTTDEEGQLSTTTSVFPRPTCEECTTFTTTWTTTDEQGQSQTESGVVEVTTDEQGQLSTTTSVFPQPTPNECEECTEFTTTFTTTDEEGATRTDSGVVIVTTDEEGALTTTTSMFPNAEECPECTEFTTEWTIIDDEGYTRTDSGVVIVSTDPAGALTTTTSMFPDAEECPECTEFTTTFTTTDEEGATRTDSGVVIVTTDEEGALTTTTSMFPDVEECPECTTFTTEWTTTDEGTVQTDSGVVVVTTDPEGKLSTTTSVFPRPTDPFTTFTTTWTTTRDDGGIVTDSGVVIVTTDEEGGITTTTSRFPEDGLTTYTTTWTTTREDGQSVTKSGVVGVTTDEQGQQTTTTSVFPDPACPECTEFTSTWTTNEEGTIITDSGVIVVTTDDDGVLTTQTSLIPRPTGDECAECTEYTSTWTTDGITESGIVIVTTDRDGQVFTSTSVIPGPPELTTYTSTWTDNEDINSGVVIVTTDENGQVATTTSVLPGPPQLTTYTTTWTAEGVTESEVVIVTTDDEGQTVTTTLPILEPTEFTSYLTTWTAAGEINSGVVIVTSDEEGRIVTSTSVFLEPTESPVATTYATAWVTTDDQGNSETVSGEVIVTSDPQGWTTTTSAYPNLGLTTTMTITDDNGNVQVETIIGTEGDKERTTSETFGVDGKPDDGAKPHTVTTWTRGDGDDVVTESGEVLETTGPDGSPFTTTVVYPGQQEPDQPSQPKTTGQDHQSPEKYTTTWVTTGPDGQPTTVAGQVVVTTENDEWITLTSPGIEMGGQPGGSPIQEQPTTRAGIGLDVEEPAGQSVDESGPHSDGAGPATGIVVEPTVSPIVDPVVTHGSPPVPTVVGQSLTMDGSGTANLVYSALFLVAMVPILVL
ncbi:hypothetical protein DICA1_E09010 [Diutina catenulata]